MERRWNLAWEKVNEKNLNNLYGYYHYDKELFNDFLKNNHIISFRKKPLMVSWEFFLTKGKDVGLKHYNEGIPPKNDHGYGFKNEKHEVFYIYQPYFAPNEIEDEVKNWANKLNLGYKILDKDKSWYNKGQTCLVLIYSKNATKPLI